MLENDVNCQNGDGFRIKILELSCTELVFALHCILGLINALLASKSLKSSEKALSYPPGLLEI